MKTASKRIPLVITLVIAIAAAVGTFWLNHAPSQIITLPNGKTYRFAGVTWGTSEAPPTLAAQLLSRLPTPVGQFVERTFGYQVQKLSRRSSIRFGQFGQFGQFVEPKPCLHVWLQSVGTIRPAREVWFGILLANQNGVVSGEVGREEVVTGGEGHAIMQEEDFGIGKTRWLSLRFPVVPRRSARLQLWVFGGPNPTNHLRPEFGRISFRNPVFGHFPQWQPEPLPAVKRAGDLEVQLLDFHTNSNGGVLSTLNGKLNEVRRPVALESSELVIRVEAKSATGTNAPWRVHSADLTDATGNRSHTERCARSETGEYRFGPALWPGESAWRLKLQLKRDRPVTGHFPDYSSQRIVLRSANQLGASNVISLGAHPNLPRMPLTRTVEETKTVEFLVKPPRAD